ncbi:MAG TPA: M20/M25/M40 family metallo-hydrolase [Opitutaceae bacterium]|nr:M20/M25/M40 family metallo-hydrolase [Opitutaceae bacterium]
MRNPFVYARKLRVLTAIAALFSVASISRAAGSKDPEIEKAVSEISAERIEKSIKTLVGFQTRHTLSDTDDPKVGIGAARNWLKAELDRYAADSGGRLQVAFDRFIQPETPPRIFQRVEIVNVVATLSGRQAESKDRIYVVTAHYDSRASSVNDTESYAPGADDDASGCAAVLELARVLSQRELDATVVFLLVAAEEQGLQGSHHWVEQAKAGGLNIAGVLNNDVIGSSTGEDGAATRNVVRLFAEGVPPMQTLPDAVFTQMKTGGENDFAPRQLARAIKSAAEMYVPDFTVRVVYRRDRYLRGGDQNSFLDAGYPAVRLSEPAENFAHQHQDVEVEDGIQYGDLPEYVDFNYVADVARVNAAALASLALAPASPVDVEVETSRLENDTRLRWKANREPDLAGYRIVWRETTAPFWEHAIDVGNVTEFTVKNISKDNVIFGVQALDTAGHVSPAVYPLPARIR